MTDSIIITEPDVLDPERAAAQKFVECGNCDQRDRVADMCRQPFGDYLCSGCDYEIHNEG